MDNQHGFRARRSCATQRVGFIHDLASTMQRDQMDVAIMDFSKAFDVVHHGRLLLKLAHFPKYKNNSILKNGLAYCKIALQNPMCK